jgi:hypothetical protein
VNFKYALAGLGIILLMAAMNFSWTNEELVRRFSPSYVSLNSEKFEGKEIAVFGLAGEGEICSDNDCILIDHDINGYYNVRGTYNSGTNTLSILRAEPESASKLSFSLLGASLLIFALYWRVKNA